MPALPPPLPCPPLHPGVPQSLFLGHPPMHQSVTLSAGSPQGKRHSVTQSLILRGPPRHHSITPPPGSAPRLYDPGPRVQLRAQQRVVAWPLEVPGPHVGLLLVPYPLPLLIPFSNLPAPPPAAPATPRHAPLPLHPQLPRPGHGCGPGTCSRGGAHEAPRARAGARPLPAYWVGVCDPFREEKQSYTTVLAATLPPAPLCASCPPAPSPAPLCASGLWRVMGGTAMPRLRDAWQ